MHDVERERDVALAKSAPRSRSRADWYESIRKHAGRMRQPGQSIQSAVAKFITEDIDGQQMHRAMKAAPSPQAGFEGYPRRGTGLSGSDIDGGAGVDRSNIGDGNGGGAMADDPDSSGPSFSALVDAHQAKNKGHTRSQSIDSVVATRAGRSALALEKRNRLARAMGG